MGRFEIRPPGANPIEKDTLSGRDACSAELKPDLPHGGSQAEYQRCASPQASHAREVSSKWTCPSCGFSQLHAVEECPRCGIVVSKISQRKRTDADCRGLPRNWHEDPRPRTIWITVVSSLVVCLALGVALLKWTGSTTPQGQGKLSQGPGQASSELKKFTYENFQSEVVAVSKNQPVLIEFYSSN